MVLVGWVMRSFGLVLIAAAAVSGCAAVSSLDDEYGSAPPDGEVTLDSGLNYYVWQHKTKPKIMVAADIEQVRSSGITAGLTMGIGTAMVPQPVLEQVAKKWFEQKEQPYCHTTASFVSHSLYSEVDFECDPPPPPPPPPPPKRKLPPKR
jgi:hypothetical protein